MRRRDNAAFDPLTLSFPKDLEEEFRLDYARKSVLHVRVGIGFAIALWALFGLLDPWIVPQVKEPAWLIRFAFVVPESPRAARRARPAPRRRAS